ncbi:type IX secretion system membrane protein PorP/SprF [Lunatibacter salilacus]|uniref:type IX secretion system membrane protein PorP/SprF n=1 Tax=Lunatibacter salilacus TaxID=2483804 RepID=UPI001F433C92|nr:type IX secretion system membrane protein PorP/SprF [Lunatibacter salilacus]
MATRLPPRRQNDPTLGKYLGTFSNLNVLDFNVGMALTHANYYFSYGVHWVNGGNIQNEGDFMDGYPAEQMVQAGFRNGLTENLALAVNA